MSWAVWIDDLSLELVRIPEPDSSCGISVDAWTGPPLTDSI